MNSGRLFSVLHFAKYFVGNSAYQKTYLLRPRSILSTEFTRLTDLFNVSNMYQWCLLNILLMKKICLLFRNSTVLGCCVLHQSSKGFCFKNYHTLKLNTYLQFAVCFRNPPSDYTSVNVMWETYIKIEKGTRGMDISLLWSHLRMDCVYLFRLWRIDP